MLINISKWRDKLTGINVLFPWHKKMSFHKSAVWTLLYKFPVLENNQNKPMLLNRTFYILIMKFYDSWIIFQIFLHCFWPRFSIPIFSRYFLQKLVSRFRLVHFNPSQVRVLTFRYWKIMQTSFNFEISDLGTVQRYKILSDLFL